MKHKSRERQLQTLLRLSEQMVSTIEMPALLERILRAGVELAGAERGTIVLVQGQKIVFGAAHTTDPDETSSLVRISTTAVKEAVKSGRAVRSSRADADSRLGRAASVAELGIRSILCLPLTLKDKILGALYLDHTERDGAFDEVPEDVLAAMGQFAAVAIENARLYEKALTKIERMRETLTLNLKELGYKTSADELVGRSRPMVELLRKVEGAIEGDYPVIVEGETGTGKELIARVIHYNSPRRDAPFVAENCGAITASLVESELFGHRKGAFTGATADRKGLFQVADGGTLFLDEIEEMPEEMQVKLLRALETREVRPVGADRAVKLDVRVIASSNRSLRDLVARGRIREDLFYRLNVFHLIVPPLRERKEDLPLLVEHFLARCARESDKPPKTVEPALLEGFCAHDWPGNVRELENDIRRLVAVTRGERIPAEAWEPRGRRAAAGTGAGAGSGLRPLLDLERDAIEQTLAAVGGNRARAAEVLGISVRTLYYKIKQYGL